jgi:hypothetical protein
MNPYEPLVLQIQCMLNEYLSLYPGRLLDPGWQSRRVGLERWDSKRNITFRLGAIELRGLGLLQIKAG